MKTILFLAMLLQMMVQMPIEESASTSDRYCIIANPDGRLLEAANGDETQSVASISKIMTAIVALEQSDQTDTWQVSKDIDAHATGSSIYLKPQQEVSMEALLYGSMLRSGNDAAYEIAKHTAGSEEAFVKLMNEKAKAIGMRNTLFHNASGLDEDGIGNVSSACDMALLMRYAMQNEDFQKITGSKYYTTSWGARWKNKNRLLFDFPFAVGGKTGFTKQAGRTLVTTAKKEQLAITVVTLDHHDDFAFHKAKHQEYLNAYRADLILKKGTYTIMDRYAQVKEDIYITRRVEEALPSVQLYRQGNEMILESNGESKLLYRWKLEKGKTS